MLAGRARGRSEAIEVGLVPVGVGRIEEIDPKVERGTHQGVDFLC